MRKLIFSIKIIGLFLFVCNFVVLAIACALITFNFNKTPSSAKNFCTKDDELYQVIVEHADEWLTYFSTTHTSLASGRQYRNILISNRSYSVLPDYSVTKDGLPILYISTLPNWPATPLGSRGYLYVSSERLIPEFWAQGYTISQLDSLIFCYRET
jgi:hypothetical protein